MKEHSLIFRGEMVRAILNGQKTQTRRLVLVLTPDRKRVPIISQREKIVHWDDGFHYISTGGMSGPHGPNYQVGDRVWVRESWADVNTESGPAILYRADQHYHWCSDDAWPVEYERYPNCLFTMWCGDLLRGEPDHAWRRSTHMPRWASRITLEITDVRIQRVQDITHEDAIAEGMGIFPQSMSLQKRFSQFWTDMHGKDAWDANPWVVALTFRRLSP